MARGVPVTPDESAAMVEAYRRLGNYAAAGRETGFSLHAVKLAVARDGEETRGSLHALACAKAERRARQYVRESNEILRRYLERMTAEAAPASDLAQIARALNDGARVIVSMNDSHSKRERVRAETKAIAEGQSTALLFMPRIVTERDLSDGTPGRLAPAGLPSESSAVQIPRNDG